jgi:nucleotide-binding universal stress UspA family protein
MPERKHLRGVSEKEQRQYEHIKEAALGASGGMALIEAAKGAELIVLGSRGRGGFLGLLLGAVSQQCEHHPPCPLVILPPPEQPRPAES